MVSCEGEMAGSKVCENHLRIRFSGQVEQIVKYWRCVKAAVPEQLLRLPIDFNIAMAGITLSD